MLQELTVLKNLKDAEHQNIISYVGACNQILTGENPYALYIITEYCQNGDLDTLLLKTNYELGWKFRVKFALEAARAVHYLHENNFIHRDIKSSVTTTTYYYYYTCYLFHNYYYYYILWLYVLTYLIFFHFHIYPILVLINSCY